jgi:hypothetical protein
MAIPDSSTSCSIPDDRIDPRRSALFMARLILHQVRDGVEACRSLFTSRRRASHCPPLVRGQWRGPKIRAAIQASPDPAWMVAERYGISEQTVWTEPRARHWFERRDKGAAAILSMTATTGRTGCRRRRRLRRRPSRLRFAGCLIPWIDGAILSQEWKEATWDRFVTGAPRSSQRGATGSSPLARARRQSSNTAIASFARAAEPGARHQSQDGREVAQALVSRGPEDRAEGAAVHRADRGRGGGGG